MCTLHRFEGIQIPRLSIKVVPVNGPLGGAHKKPLIHGTGSGTQDVPLGNGNLANKLGLIPNGEFTQIPLLDGPAGETKKLIFRRYYFLYPTAML